MPFEGEEGEDHRAKQKRLIQLMDVITHQDTNKESHLPATKSKEDEEITLATEQVSTSQPLLVIVYDRCDACGQILAFHIPTFNYLHDTGLKDFSDSTCSVGICKANIVAESKEQKQEKLKEQEHLYHPSEPESAPLRQSIQDDVLVDPSQAAWGEMCHSWVYQPVERFSFPTHSFGCEVSRFLTGAGGKTLASPLYSLRSGHEYLKDTQKYVRYGIGKGEKVEPQRPIHHKTEVFVSSTAPPSPPPSPPDWLARLRWPKRAEDPGAIHSPSQSPSTVLGTAATPRLLCLQTIPEAGLPLPPTNVDLSAPVPELVQYCEVLTHDLLLLEEDEGQSPTMSPPPAMSCRTKIKDRVTSRVGRAPVMQSPASVVFPSTRSAFAQSSKPSATRVTRYSGQSTTRSSLSPPSRYLVALAKSSPAPLSGHSTLKSSQCSALLSLSSHPRASQVSIPSGQHSRAQPPRRSLAQSRSGLQSTRPSVVQSKH
ncbi:hypothetical protein H920_19061 [Fukomys damarensis]|uniref:Uncharacterized protein n=1 Tax=Fukomys damarensis TaxID=885580 RepID=A0A091CQI0_FUKDA|nr:hypothetical protein H920_19061 [Fukomys damarensis]